jgi:hypothetical protein
MPPISLHGVVLSLKAQGQLYLLEIMLFEGKAEVKEIA